VKLTAPAPASTKNRRYVLAPLIVKVLPAALWKFVAAVTGGRMVDRLILAPMTTVEPGLPFAAVIAAASSAAFDAV
jgi:hypothetical protein